MITHSVFPIALCGNGSRYPHCTMESPCLCRAATWGRVIIHQIWVSTRPLGG